MNRRIALVAGLLAVFMAVGFAGLPGCTPTVLLNQTKVRQGNITMVFINTTPFTAIFSYATWDAWDNTPGTISLQQLRLDAHQITEPATIPCARNAAVGTAGLVQRVIETETDQNQPDFDAEALDTVVRFSSAPADTSTAGLPTEGTAVGIEKLLGVHYSCGDQLIFTFVEDPDASGGYRIDYQVILDDLPNR